MDLKLVLNIVLAAAIVACVVGAGVLIVSDSRSSGAIEITLPPPTPVPVEPQSVARIMVYVSGEVVRPGVYRLDPDNRVADALNAAGGPTADADLDRINLALRLTDEEQVHIPAVGSSGSVPVGAAGQSPSAITGKLDLNTATVDELEALPGIGGVRAAAIVEHRNTHGPFERVDDLVEVSGIGDGILGSIMHLIEVR